MSDITRSVLISASSVTGMLVILFLIKLLVPQENQWVVPWVLGGLLVFCYAAAAVISVVTWDE